MRNSRRSFLIDRPSISMFARASSSFITMSILSGPMPVLNAVIAVLFVLAGLSLLVGALLIAVPVRNASRRA